MDVQPGGCQVMADPTQIQQVVTNLAVNARDAMPNGGELAFRLSSLEVQAGQPTLARGVGAGAWAVLEVSDTGVGMTAEVRERVFEPFFTTKASGQGTGLGLAQVYGIVKQHAGHVAVESRPGSGTTFTIYLPMVMAGRLGMERDAGDRTPLGNGETLLLVEDDAVLLDAMDMLLDHLDYRVLTATNGYEALDLYDQHRDEIALVLTDVTMPTMGGMELFQLLRQRDPDVRVIALSGYSPGRQSREWLAEGVLDWIEKPPELHRLAEALRRGVEGAPRPADEPAVSLAARS